MYVTYCRSMQLAGTQILWRIWVGKSIYQGVRLLPALEGQASRAVHPRALCHHLLPLATLHSVPQAAPPRRMADTCGCATNLSVSLLHGLGNCVHVVCLLTGKRALIIFDQLCGYGVQFLPVLRPLTRWEHVSVNVPGGNSCQAIAFCSLQGILTGFYPILH